MRDDQSGFRPDRLIEWTGERCVPWTGDLQVVYEHYHRYLLARPLVEGKRVLDLASGEGYGAALLAERATQVIGVEIDPASVEHIGRPTRRRAWSSWRAPCWTSRRFRTEASTS